MILDNDHAKRKASQEKRILRVNPTVNIIPIQLVRRNVDVASTKTKITLGILNKPFTARQKREGEAQARTLSIFDRPTLSSDNTPELKPYSTRPGADQAALIKSRGAST